MVAAVGFIGGEVSVQEVFHSHEDIGGRQPGLWILIPTLLDCLNKCTQSLGKKGEEEEEGGGGGGEEEEEEGGRGKREE